jgi:hypothetical protein
MGSWSRVTTPGWRRPKRLAVVALSLMLVGCLFPSFDKFEAGLGDDDDGGKEDADKDRRDVDSKERSESASTETSGPAPDAGEGGGGVLAKEVRCGTESCPVPAEYCCTTIGGPDCQSGTEAFCIAPQGGEIIKCDGHEDCDPGQVCCYESQEQTATCRTSCPTGRPLCNGPSRICPTGKSCTGTVLSMFRACE